MTDDRERLTRKLTFDPRKSVTEAKRREGRAFPPPGRPETRFTGPAGGPVGTEGRLPWSRERCRVRERARTDADGFLARERPGCRRRFRWPADATSDEGPARYLPLPRRGCAGGRPVDSR